MKILRSAVSVLLGAGLLISAASISNAQARDSFSLGINVGGYGYPPPVYYAPPVFYNPPVVYYSGASNYYNRSYYNSAPVLSYEYANGGSQSCRRGDGHEEREHHGWRDDDHEHHGWGHNGYKRGHHDDDDD